MAKNQPTKERLSTIKLPEEVWRKMKSIAALKGVPLNHTLWTACTEYIERQEAR